ncbi:MAG: hypothetical protein H0X34_05805 [Chthoniobacterales bacterium]|nr:hypothetical protein [Chthoniobacterales bacterium]
MQLTRHLFGVTLTMAGVLLATSSLYALRRPPFFSWIRDQSTVSSTAPVFATQYFRLKDFDGNGVSFTRSSTNGSVFNAMNVRIMPCDPILDPNCTGVQDQTGYKVSFTGPALSQGATTITLSATGKNGGATAYSSFTLRWASAGLYPPTIEALPNQTIRLSSPSNGTATYSTMFVIGDLQNDGTTEDVDSIGTGDFTVTSNNTILLPNSPNNISLARMPAPLGYIDQATPRQYLLQATTAAGQQGVATVTVEFHDPDLNSTSTSFVLQAIDFNNTPPSISNASNQRRISPIRSLLLRRVLLLSPIQSRRAVTAPWCRTSGSWASPLTQRSCQTIS